MHHQNKQRCDVTLGSEEKKRKRKEELLFSWIAKNRVWFINLMMIWGKRDRRQSNKDGDTDKSPLLCTLSFTLHTYSAVSRRAYHSATIRASSLNDWLWNGTFKLHAAPEWFSCLPWCLFCYGNSWCINITSRSSEQKIMNPGGKEEALSTLICELINTHTVLPRRVTPCRLDECLALLTRVPYC